MCLVKGIHEYLGLPSLQDRCRVREVAVEFLGSWLSSYVPYQVRDAAAEFSRSLASLGGRC